MATLGAERVPYSGLFTVAADKAKAARDKGHQLFVYWSMPLVGAKGVGGEAPVLAGTVEAIEAVGWRLDHVVSAGSIYHYFRRVG